MTPCQSPEEPRPRGRWKHGAIPVIGLIGGLGSGKSLLARRLAARGAVVIDADAVGHRWLEDPQVRGRIVERFGPGVLAEPGPGGAAAPIDRRALGAIVFADPVARAALEAILHPPMRAEFRAAIGRALGAGAARLVVLDAAILLEAGWDDLCDRIVFVEAPRPERVRRLATARGWSEATVAAREQAQWPEDRKRRRADWIVRNDAGPERLDEEADRLLAWLRDAAPPAGATPSPRLDDDPAGAATEAMPGAEAVTLNPPTLGGRTS